MIIDNIPSAKCTHDHSEGNTGQPDLKSRRTSCYILSMHIYYVVSTLETQKCGRDRCDSRLFWNIFLSAPGFGFSCMCIFYTAVQRFLRIYISVSLFNHERVESIKRCSRTQMNIGQNVFTR